jgi:UDP-glucose 4-epimerase
MDHYTITPYTFVPKLGRKYVKHYYIDIGQGLLLCMQEMFDKIHNMENQAPEEDR